MKRIISSLVIILIASVVLYGATGTPSTLIVRTDANDALIVASATQVNPVTSGVFSSRRLRTDASGNLQVILSGTVTPTYPLSVPASVCSAPSIGESGTPQTGIAFATTSVLLCVSGTQGHIFTSTSHFYGGTSASEAGFSRSGTQMRAVLANLSDFADFNAKNLLSETNIQLAQTGVLYWNGGSQAVSAASGQLQFRTTNGTDGLLNEQFTNNPTCATNCGTSPTLAGVDSSFTLTMGATGVPASGFIVTFNGTWPAAPQCVGAMALAGMAVGKLPLTLVTTTTNLTVVTNGVAPATSDKYHFRCSSGQ